MNRRVALVVRFAVVATVAAIDPPEARAGDNPLEVTIVDASPRAPANQKCVRALFRCKSEPYVWDPTCRTLDQVRAKLPSPLPPTILAWDASAAERLRAVDAAIIVDCRPADGVLDIVVKPTSAGVVTFRVRHLQLTPRLLGVIAERAVRAAYDGFME